MRLMIHGKGIELTPALRGHVGRKLGKLDKYFDADLPAQVTLAVEKERHIVEVTLPIDGRLLRGEEASADMYASIDAVVEKLERQIHKYKTLLNRKQRRDATVEPSRSASAAVEPAPPAPAEGEVVRVKHFPFRPMPVEEAILQMNLLGHDFFVFVNAETEQVNVVYRRRGGGYGLIEPGF